MRKKEATATEWMREWEEKKRKKEEEATERMREKKKSRGERKNNIKSSWYNILFKKFNS